MRKLNLLLQTRTTLLFTFALLVCACAFLPQVGHAKGCGVGVVSLIGQKAGRGFSLRKMPNLMSDFYSEADVNAFQTASKQAKADAEIINQGYSKASLIPMPGTERELRNINNRLLKHWAGPVPDYRLSISTNLHYGAMVTQDAHMVFPIGFLELVKSDDELAFILAHELSHLLLGHTRIAVEQKKRTKALRALKANFKNIVGASSIELSEQQQLDLVEREKIEKLNNQASTYHRRIQRTLRDVLHPNWSKRHEDEADLLGMELLFKAGFNPVGATDAIKRIQEVRKNGCAAFAKLGADLKEFMQAEMLPTVEKLDVEDNQNWFDNLKTKIRKFSSRNAEKILIRQALPRSHRTEKDRIKYFGKFTEREAIEDIYYDALDVKMSGAVVKRIHQSAEFKAALRTAMAIPAAYDGIQQADLDVAGAQLNKMQMTQEGRLIKYRWRKAQGSTKAIGNLRIALRAERPSLDAMELFAMEGLKDRHATEVANALDKMELIYGDKTHFLPEHIYIAAMKADPDAGKINELVKQCVDSGLGYLEGPCFAAAFGRDADFRTNYERILAASTCQADKDAGGDVECKKPKPKFTLKEFFNDLGEKIRTIEKGGT